MIKLIFVLFDAKAQIYSQPFYAIRKEIALRDFVRVVNDPDSDIFHSPGDFDLFQVGEFDDELCTFEVHRPEFIQNGAFLRKFDAE